MIVNFLNKKEAKLSPFKSKTAKINLLKKKKKKESK